MTRSSCTFPTMCQTIQEQETQTTPSSPPNPPQAPPFSHLRPSTEQTRLPGQTWILGQPQAPIVESHFHCSALHATSQVLQPVLTRTNSVPQLMHSQTTPRQRWPPPLEWSQVLPRKTSAQAQPDPHLRSTNARHQTQLLVGPTRFIRHR